jgi:hypothetical protein
MKRSFPLLFLLALIVAACSQASEPATTIPPTLEPATEEAKALESEVQQPGAAPTEVIPTESSTETLSDPTDTPVIEPTEETTVDPTATLAPTAEEETIFNGPYENTYFRGSAAAPVTLIDYSDFL